MPTLAASASQHLGAYFVSMHTCVGTCVYAQSCLTFCNPMGYSPPDSLLHGISQAQILEWVAISLSRGLSQPRDQTWVSAPRADTLPLSHLGSLEESTFFWDFPGGPVVKIQPSNAGGMGSIPGWGIKIPHAAWCGQNIKKKEKKEKK